MKPVSCFIARIHRELWHQIKADAIEHGVETVLRNVFFWILILLLMSGCTSSLMLAKPVTFPACHAIFDAGRTGTRLFIYYQQNGEWNEVEGPKAGPLTTANSIVNIVSLLEHIKTGPQTEKVFDWSTKCDSLSTIQVLATAGMRLEEKTAPENSASLWNNLNEALHSSYGSTLADISTKTITGDEEAIYAWLAVKHWRNENKIEGVDFGLAEMGGGSSQIAFPCGTNCVNAKVVKVDGQEIGFFVHSFLGLGTTELPGSLQLSDDIPQRCEWGVATRQPHWQREQCLISIETMLVDTAGAIRDPSLNDFVSIPNNDHISDWYLAGSFAYMDLVKNADVGNCCEQRYGMNNGCYEKENSCYLAIYQPFYLEAIGVKNIKEAKQSKKSWTMGAAVCAASDCLKKRKLRTCEWLPEKKCLAESVLVKPNS